MRLTKPLDIAPTDQRAPDVEERLVDVGSPLVAHLQPSVAIDPRQRPLHHPPMPSQSLAGFDASPGDARSYAPLPERLSTAPEVVGLVGVQLLRALGRSAPARLADIGAMASTISSSALESWTLAAVWITASGTPFRSTTTWRFDPDLPLSVGFGPVFWPPRGRPRLPSPKMPAPSRSRPPCPGDPRASFGVDPTHPPRAMLRGVASSRSCPSRSPSPSGASPRGCPS